MKARGGYPFGLMQILKKCQICVVQMEKNNMVHSFYYIPKGLPSPSHNFSGSGDTYLSQGKEFFCKRKHFQKDLRTLGLHRLAFC
jgi:hypothetical protein